MQELQQIPLELTNTQLVYSFVYIFVWKLLLVGPISSIPVAIWMLGISLLIKAPSSTYESGGLTIEVLVRWSFFLLAGIVIGQILCVILVSISLGFYSSFFPLTPKEECQPLATREIAINMYQSIASHSSSDTLPLESDSPKKSPHFEKSLVIPEPLHHEDNITPSAPSPQQNTAAIDSFPIENTITSDPFPNQNDHPITQEHVPNQYAIEIEPSSTGEATTSSIPMENTITPTEEASSPVEDNSEAIAKLKEDIHTLDESIQEYKQMEARANNKLRRKLERERKAAEEQREKLLIQLQVLENTRPLAIQAPMDIPESLTITMPEPRGTIDFVSHLTSARTEYTSDYDHIPHDLTYGSFNAGSMGPPVYRNVGNFIDNSPPTYDAFLESPGYDVCSPSFGSTFQMPARPFRLYRSLNQNFGPILNENDVLDNVHLTAYAPACVARNTTFPFSLWAFLVNQRDEMHEEATSDNVSRRVSRELAFQLRRGALIHATLELPQGFALDNDKPTKPLPWLGKSTSVKYLIKCLNSAPNQALIKATVVVGTKVMFLSAYIYVGMVANDKLFELDSSLEVLAETHTEIPYNELQMKELVGRGNFGDAYRALYKGQEVVVKTIRKCEFGSNDSQIVKEFQHEAAVLAMFGHHPNIVPFIGASTDPTMPLSLVTKYLPFGSLESQLSLHSLSAHQKRTLLADAAAGFLNIHEGGFIHRDIAARNCLVDDDFRGKICDFGMCRRVNSYGGSHFDEGVVPLKYMAPESLNEPHAFSFMSDSFSFGVLMWETFTESRPFEGIPAYKAAMHIVGGGRLEISPSIPVEFRPLIESCFHEDPSKRPSMAAILEALLPVD